jgi:uncharacterized SAM-binding protein YcdF (DUF218 family)
MKETKRSGNSLFVKVVCALLMGAGAVLIALSAIAVAVSTAVTIGMIMPMVLGLLMVVYAVVRLKKRGRVFRQRWLRVVITVVLVAGLLGAAFFEILMNVAAYREPPDDDAGFVIVLGCGVFADGQLTLSLKNRLDAAYDYLAMHEESLCIVSGGQGANEPVSEAQAMSAYLRSRGIEPKRILMEDQSDSTLRNLMYSQRIMIQYPQQPQTAAIVTSDYHVYRALMVAKGLGYDAFGIPAATNWKIVVACHVREYAAIIKTWLLGGEKV